MYETSETVSDGMILKAAEIISVSSWNELQNAININPGSDRIIQLSKDIEANGKNYLNVQG